MYDVAAVVDDTLLQTDPVRADQAECPCLVELG
jgi:hypothetical protein